MDVRKLVPFVISEGAELDIEQAITRFHGNGVTLGGRETRSGASDDGGFVVDGPAEVFHLARGNDGATFSHVGSPVEDENDGALVGVDGATSDSEWQIADDTVANTCEVGGSAMGRDDPKVNAGNNTVRATIDKSITQVSGFMGDGAGPDRLAFECGRCRPRGQA